MASVRQSKGRWYPCEDYDGSLILDGPGCNPFGFDKKEHAKKAAAKVVQHRHDTAFQPEKIRDYEAL